MSEPYDTMLAITEMFALKDGEPTEGHLLSFNGFVSPAPPLAGYHIHNYGQAALSVRGTVSVTPTKGMFGLYGSVASLDDSGISFFGPHESLEKATKRYHAFKKLIEDWHPLFPLSNEELDKWAQDNYITVSYW